MTPPTDENSAVVLYASKVPLSRVISIMNWLTAGQIED